MQNVAVASINLLGDAYNALEFTEPESSSPKFAVNYEKVRTAFMALTSQEVLDESNSLGFAVQTELQHNNFAMNCTASFLDRDYTLSLARRTNLIVGGMVPIPTDGSTVPLFKLASSWRKLIQAQRDSYKESGLDDSTLLWDIACSLAAERALPAYTEISEESYLNPERLVRNAENLLAPLSDQKVVVIAAQEFPKPGTGKFNALQKVMQQKQLIHVEGNRQVAFIFSSALEVQQHCTSPLGTSAAAVVDAVNQKLSDLPPIHLTADDLRLLETAFRKTIVLDVAPSLRFINVHAKELKTTNATQFLARYFVALTDSTRDNVLLSDTNIPNAARVAVFEAGCKECGAELLTPPGLVTTRKQRSELHGQLHDAKKCNVVVEAHKDFVLFVGGAKNWLPSPARASPDLAADPRLLLPNSAWASDHCMVTALLSSSQRASVPN